MPADLYETFRAEATYRVSFDVDLSMPIPALAHRLADMISEFKPIEIRVSAPEQSIVMFVAVPADVMPEALDRKAEALRAKWAADLVNEGT